ncbi:tryptophan 2,3-dioxygenase family protein [Roseivivax sp. GX 12232]|uniref:tryptophan 2,3-dioxygenase n=1 Tax=Roseivivax sp. GX 12232 TaxID=2900547 RepID=UPI001E5268A5|nr:tryptophan 2,3-dioxygenase family protein [Roseivivax sp. GX 12232]MCE0505824.1 tryptophan 2,3-dioxygenase family protein [Roseivivax sp. GX 12232]
MSDPYNPEDDGAQMSFDRDMSYGDYLGLDRILTAQAPLSTAHDEMLFIIQHQTSELWMKLALHELNAAREAIAAGAFQPAFKVLSRVARIFDQLNSAWDVLRTMTPSDYTTFRESLGKSSGFQSHQYRLIEYVLGNRNLNLMKVHDHRPDVLALLEGELARPSLYHVTLEALAGATGHSLPDAAYQRRAPHAHVPEVEAAWREVYLDTTRYWTLYELAEKLVDLEDYFRRWRFNHVTTVERVIGFKRGTGGTSGVVYLRKMLDVELFPELWSVRGGL